SLSSRADLNVASTNGADSVLAADIIGRYELDGEVHPAYGMRSYGRYAEIGFNIELNSADRDPTTGYFVRRINLSEGSGGELRQFSDQTDFGADLSDLVVTLSTGFDGRTFYNASSSEKSITIFSNKTGRVSLRLVAPQKREPMSASTSPAMSTISPV